MLQIHLTWIQIFAGNSLPILQANKLVTYLPPGWIRILHQYLVHYNIQVEVWGLWTPTKQRENDRVIMDIVQRQIPDWAWAGINRCRLFLRANTLADLTSLDGTYIPEKVRNVTDKLRHNNLLFPIQTKPPQDDVQKWQFFIDSISHNGHVHVPLGAWTRFPDQDFKFMRDDHNKLVFRRRGQSWEIFQKNKVQSRRFLRQRRTVRNIPRHCYPISVIASANYLIATHADTTQPISNGERNYWPRIASALEEEILGTYVEHAPYIHKLEDQWHNSVCSLVGATDGGLKDTIGSSSYALYFPHDLQPIIWGYAGEYQPRVSSSSTRQELRGQLGIEYCLRKFHRRWGTPRGQIHLTLVTDSKASIDIIDNIPNIVGIKDTLRAEMDIGLELYSQRVHNARVHRNTIKVTSHIAKDEAPNEFLWECNEYADRLATKAREEVVVAQLRSKKDHVFPGAKAACIIHNRIENNSLYEVLRSQVHGRDLQMYLLQRYGWTAQIFDSIDWITHKREFTKISKLQRVTLIKLIHGWLATSRRRYRTGGVEMSSCPLCTAEETRQHIFKCFNPHFVLLRQQRWAKLLLEIRADTALDFQAVFVAGLGTVIAQEPQTAFGRSEWPPELRAAFDSQTEIGWDQVFYGRLSKQWEHVARYREWDQPEKGITKWTGRAIRAGWGFGLDLWKFRNELAHGTTGGPSVMEQRTAQSRIKELYRILRDEQGLNLRATLLQDEKHTLLMPYDSQKAWIERVQYLFPEIAKTVRTRTQEMTAMRE